MGTGLVVDKSIANQVILLLKKGGILDDTAKIEQLGDEVIIPLLHTDFTLPKELDYELSNHDFQTRGGDKTCT